MKFSQYTQFVFQQIFNCLEEIINQQITNKLYNCTPIVKLLVLKTKRNLFSVLSTVNIFCITHLLNDLFTPLYLRPERKAFSSEALGFFAHVYF